MALNTFSAHTVPIAYTTQLMMQNIAWDVSITSSKVISTSKFEIVFERFKAVFITIYISGIKRRKHINPLMTKTLATLISLSSLGMALFAVNFFLRNLKFERNEMDINLTSHINHFGSYRDILR